MLGIRLALALGTLSAASPFVHAQSFNFDFGDAASGPPASYAAAGVPGFWNAVPALHGTTTSQLRDLSGALTDVSIRQVGGLSLASQNDPLVLGADALLLDDYLVTFSATLESCIFLDGMEPGVYEVTIYARMPVASVMSFTSVDQEPGFPHYQVGGVWTGSHTSMVSYSRHWAVVGPTGDLDLHSGVVPGALPALGAALNGLQVLRLDVFGDSFEADTVR